MFVFLFLTFSTLQFLVYVKCLKLECISNRTPLSCSVDWRFVAVAIVAATFGSRESKWCFYFCSACMLFHLTVSSFFSFFDWIPSAFSIFSGYFYSSIVSEWTTTIFVVDVSRKFHAVKCHSPMHTEIDFPHNCNACVKWMLSKRT